MQIRVALSFSPVWLTLAGPSERVLEEGPSGWPLQDVLVDARMVLLSCSTMTSMKLVIPLHFIS